MELPKTLPKLTGRDPNGDGLAYECQWGREEPRFVAIEQLVEKYGERIKDLIETFDMGLDVELDIEKVLNYNQSKGKYLVRWKGYPEMFATWQPKDDMGDGADELIAAMPRKRGKK